MLGVINRFRSGIDNIAKNRASNIVRSKVGNKVKSKASRNKGIIDFYNFYYNHHCQFQKIA